MTQTTVLVFTLLAMAMPALGYGLAWAVDPRHTFSRALRAYGEVTSGVVVFTAATLALIAEYETLIASGADQVGEAS